MLPALLGLLALAPASAAAAAVCSAAAAAATGACEALAAEGEAPALALAQRAQRALLAPRRAGGQEQALPSIGFVKTHKTGGSTASDMLHRLAGKRSLRFVNPNDGGVIDWKLFEQTVPPQHQFDLIACHSMFDEQMMKAYLKTEPFFLTVLREPVARLDSSFRFRAEKHQREKGKFPDDWGARLETIAEDPLSHVNALARDLGWYDGVDVRRRSPYGNATRRNDHNPEAIADFVSYIDKTMDLVFLTEYYDEGLVLLTHKLNISLEDVAYIKAKETKVTSDDVAPPTEEQLKELHEEVLSVDKPLYEHFATRFWREWEEHGGYPKLGAEVEELKARNAKLAEDCAAEPRDPKLCPDVLLMDGGLLRAYVCMHGNRANCQYLSQNMLEKAMLWAS